MKKRFLILPLLAGLTLCGCDFFGKKDSGPSEEQEEQEEYEIVPEFASGTEDEKTAILKGLNNLSPVTNNKGASFYPDFVGKLVGDESHFLKLTKELDVSVNSHDYTVNFEWAIETQNLVDAITAYDEAHDKVTIKYPAFGEGDREFKWSISKATCGSAVSTKTNASYKATVKAETHIFEEMSLEQMYSITDEPKAFTDTVGGKSYNWPSYSNIVNYERYYHDDANNKDVYSPDFITANIGTEEEPVYDRYKYVILDAQVLFVTPDGKWALVGNGSNVIEIFAGSGLQFTEENYPDIKVGHYVRIKGELSSFYGCFQISFINKVIALTDHSTVAPVPSEYAALTEAKIAANKVKQFTNDIKFHQFMTVTGTVKAASKVNLGSSGRYTFVLTVGSEEIKVAYDYHIDSSAKALTTKLLEVYNGGGSVTITGSMRFRSRATDSDAKEHAVINLDSADVPEWNIVPISAAAVVQ